MTEVWLRGPVEGVAPELMPVVHSLLQVREELERAARSLSRDELWKRPGGAASIGFHLKHIAGSLDRLTTYAGGRQLDAGQLEWLKAEERVDSEDAGALLDVAIRAIDEALERTRATPIERLGEARAVGRSRLPSTVLGLLFHAAEHAQRHAGQIATTIRVLRG
jgi:uncharacterized damage-inducible protein DinB